MPTHAQPPVLLAEIAVLSPAFKSGLTYAVPAHLAASVKPLAWVTVPLGKRLVSGVVLKIGSLDSAYTGSVKEIVSVLEGQPLGQKQLELCQFVSDYYFAPIGEVLKLCMPPKALKRPRKNPPAPFCKGGKEQELELSPDQQEALAAIDKNHSGAFLLEGVTGSGKTEVYLRLAKKALVENKGVVVIVPEIGLTPQLYERFTQFLQVPIAQFHSGLSPSEKLAAFQQLQSGDRRVLIGARSALFAPMPNLGLIVIDEEHDNSLKQEETPRYHARDVALWRAQNEKAKIVLGSATPSLESLINAQKGKLTHLKMQTRFGNAGNMPKVEIIDLRTRAKHSLHKRRDKSLSEGSRVTILSAPLQLALDDCLAKGEQAIIFLNRRGHATFCLCDACGQIVKCPHCSVSMVFHQKANALRCHQCSYFCQLPSQCSSCNLGPILRLGLGTERVEQELQLRHPDAKIARLDRDVAQSKARLHNTLDQMHDRQIDILVGTQMIAKGHDFSGVSLVGVVMADTMLSMPDFRAAEKTFQMLTQVSGRCGRADIPGKVIVQTFNPEHPSIVFAQNHDLSGFAIQEIANRQLFWQPPFSRAALIRIESTDNELAMSLATEFQKFLIAQIQNTASKQAQLLGPALAPIERIRGKTRVQLYLRCATVGLRHELIKAVSSQPNWTKSARGQKTRIIVDIDPVMLM